MSPWIRMSLPIGTWLIVESRARARTWTRALISSKMLVAKIKTIKWM
jgi:hypothetical protein